MSVTATAPQRRRVRHEARDAAVLMLFSAGLSLGGAGLLLALTALATGR